MKVNKIEKYGFTVNIGFGYETNFNELKIKFMIMEKTIEQ